MRTVLAPSLLVLWLLPAAAPARPMPMDLRLARTDDIRAVAEVDGTIWQATTGGLVVLREGRLRHFSSADGLPPGRLHALLARSDGSLWVGGDHGLVRVAATADPDRLKLLQRISIRGVRALARLGDTLFVGTWGHGLQRLQADQRRPRPLRLGSARALARVTSLAVSGTMLYVGTAGAGLCRYDGHRVRRISRRSLPSPMVWALSPTRAAGGVWVATLGGLALVRGTRVVAAPEVRASQTLPLRDLRAVLAQPRGLFLGTFGDGLYQIQGRRVSRVAGVPRGGQVWHVTQGTGQRLLAATAQGTVVVETGGAPLVLPTRPGPLCNDVSALAVSSHGLWVGTFDAGLSLFSPGAGTWRHFGRREGLIDDRINQIAVTNGSSGSQIWVATPKGVSRFQGNRWVSFPAGEDLCPGHVNGIHADAGRVTLASTGGISVITGGGAPRCIVRAHQLGLRQLTAVVADRDGALWVGGLDGLAHQQADGSWARLSVATGHLPDNWVTALAVTPAGRLWIGTYDGGVAWLEGRRSRVIREADGLPCGWVNPNALTWWGGRLWLGTMEGGLVFRGATGAWRHLGTTDGLPSADVTAVVPDADGRLWIASRGGVVRLNPRRLEKER